MKSNSFNLLIAVANKLAKNYFCKFFNALLIPVDYTRTKEIPAILDLSGILKRKDEKLKILDIGSPQLLSLSLGSYSDLWEITYLNSHEPELKDLRQKSSALGLRRLKSINADITSADNVSQLGTFDYVFSCSVFEHIHPEDGGDALASEMVPRLLKPSGLFLFSVPYYKKKFNEYLEGDIYAIEGKPQIKTFFQRFYDEESLYAQIITPTGLRIAEKTYIGERYYSVNNIKKRMAFLVGFGKRAYIMGRFFHMISDVFMEESNDYKKLKKPYLAICALIKD
ncbi:MAG: class I SAM-dependent methyltransferase [Deltaproteobacteria bacterium]|nr:class I SAM-dependent methyltransferase [Deltaproteobacteria bacterium]